MCTRANVHSMFVLHLITLSSELFCSLIPPVSTSRFIHLFPPRHFSVWAFSHYLLSSYSLTLSVRAVLYQLVSVPSFLYSCTPPPLPPSPLFSPLSLQCPTTATDTLSNRGNLAHSSTRNYKVKHRDNTKHTG